MSIWKAEDFERYLRLEIRSKLSWIDDAGLAIDPFVQTATFRKSQTEWCRYYYRYNRLLVYRYDQTGEALEDLEVYILKAPGTGEGAENDNWQMETDLTLTHFWRHFRESVIMVACAKLFATASRVIIRYLFTDPPFDGESSGILGQNSALDGLDPGVKFSGQPMFLFSVVRVFPTIGDGEIPIGTDYVIHCRRKEFYRENIHRWNQTYDQGIFPQSAMFYAPISALDPKLLGWGMNKIPSLPGNSRILPGERKRRAGNVSKRTNS